MAKTLIPAHDRTVPVAQDVRLAEWNATIAYYHRCRSRYGVQALVVPWDVRLAEFNAATDRPEEP